MMKCYTLVIQLFNISFSSGTSQGDVNGRNVKGVPLRGGYIFCCAHDLLQSSESPQAEECSKANAIINNSTEYSSFDLAEAA